MPPLPNDLAEQRRVVTRLRRAVYSRPDPADDPDQLKRLAKAEADLHTLEQQAPALPAPAPAEPTPHGRLLGPETTGLKVTTTVRLQPIPTGIYHLLDPQTEPLVSVVVENVAPENKPRRVCIKAFLEALSAETVRTVEIKRKEKAELALLPTLFPERARLLTEVQRSTLHVLVTDLDGKPECHDTFTVLCLARTSSFNAVCDPATGQRKDLSHYYGAWVTPYAEPVLALLRQAAEKCEDGMMVGYQGDVGVIERQVQALFLAVHEAGVRYINTILDHGAAEGAATQRTRLPRESLACKSANCIDGAVLMASLLEAASLHAALVFVPGHAFVGWQSGDDPSSDWRYLETTMIQGGDFKAACESGQRQYEEAQKYYPTRLREHRLPDLRARGIYPME
jgi:hypothetical protein